MGINGTETKACLPSPKQAQETTVPIARYQKRPNGSERKRCIESFNQHFLGLLWNRYPTRNGAGVRSTYPCWPLETAFQLTPAPSSGLHASVCNSMGEPAIKNERLKSNRKWDQERPQQPSSPYLVSFQKPFPFNVIGCGRFTLVTSTVVVFRWRV